MAGPRHVLTSIAYPGMAVGRGEAIAPLLCEDYEETHRSENVRRHCPSYVCHTSLDG